MHVILKTEQRKMGGLLLVVDSTRHACLVEDSPGQLALCHGTRGDRDR